jgi:toxin ParE1/3/4
VKQPGKKRAAAKHSVAYTLSRKAEEDIIDIFLRGADQFGLQQAEHYHILLDKSFQFLAENPLAANLRTEITPPMCLSTLFESHLIVYTTDGEGMVYIIRVRHSHEEWQAREK